MAGVTSTGFIPKTIDEVFTDIQTDLRSPSGIDPAIDLSPDQPLGQIIGAACKPIAEVWEVAQAVANALNPNAAEGAFLENTCSITGTLRDGATYSLVVANLSLNAAVTVAAGAIASVNGQPSNRWILLGKYDPVTGRTVLGNVTSVLTGTYQAVFRSENTGPQVANAGTLTTIVTTTTGWTAITNPSDAELGQTIETDAHLRVKRRNELAAPGGCTPDAIRAKLLQLTGMIEARVFENTDNVPDVDGRPSRSLEAVIWDGALPAVLDLDIATTLWTNKAGGVATYGLTSTTITDTIGVVRPVRFTRAVQVPMSVAINVQVDSNLFPSDGVAQIKAAIVALGAKQHVGGSAYILTFMTAVVGSVAGIANIISYLHGPTAGAGATLSTPVVATNRQILTFDTSHVTVTLS